MKTILILSGGLDSTVALYWLKAKHREIKAISFDYGQRHAKELNAAEAICKAASTEWVKIDLTALKPILAGSSQTDNTVEVPEGHYADENMKLTIVPNRNMIMLSIATAYAISQKADTVCYAAHAGDHAIYPDCRPEFVMALDVAIALADWHHVKLEGPFTEWSKADIVKEGQRLKVPFKLTWSCYKGKEKHCGKCGTCVERAEAFELANVIDPTIYE